MKKVLMHVCCAPCFITIQEDIEKNGMLIDGKREKVELSAYWYNPNIHPKAEYERRKESFVKFCDMKSVDKIICDEYDLNGFVKDVVENVGENKKYNIRCKYCYYRRLENVFKYASENGYDIVSTTLTRSPYQNHDVINKVAEELSKKGDSISYAEFNQMYHKIFGTGQSESTKQEVKEEKQEYQLDDVVKQTKPENVSLFENTEEQKKPVYKLIGVAFLTYIIIEMGNEIYMIDQHAAHERILYEKVKKNYYNQVGVQSQLMLLPDIITLSHKEMGVMKDNMDMFKKAGFELEEFGENTIKLTGVPSICLNMNTKELFLETLDEINTVARTAKQEIEDRFIATIACKAAVKANMALTKEEIDNLMTELLKLPNPFTCPHGRPTAIKMTKADLERKFSRR